MAPRAADKFIKIAKYKISFVEKSNIFDAYIPPNANNVAKASK